MSSGEAKSVPHDDDPVPSGFILPGWQVSAIEAARDERDGTDVLRWGDLRRGLANAVPPKPEAKTVRVRVAVAVNANGAWHAAGRSHTDGERIADSYLASEALDCVHDDGSVSLNWVEATLKVPQHPSAPTVEAEVKP